MNLLCIYNILHKAYGDQNWWPAETFDEIIIGAILTQNTNWTNVEKAIRNLKNQNICSLKDLSNMETEVLGEIIKPSGYYNQKAKRLINVAKEFVKLRVKNQPPLQQDNRRLPLRAWRGEMSELWTARKILLSINGIGPETADSILLYAFEKPIFVIDAYTIRVFSRLGLVFEKNTYDAYQDYFMKHLEHDVRLFNEYHALIVRHCKVSCMKKPICAGCCLGDVCLENTNPKS